LEENHNAIAEVGLHDNLYNQCVANQMVEGSQGSIIWHLDFFLEMTIS
jgi:hypothetical protein